MPETTEKSSLSPLPATTSDLHRRDLTDTSRRRRSPGRFSTEGIVSVLKTLAWVIPLTALIWIYAEREQVATDPGVPIPLDVKTSDSGRFVMLLSPRDKNVLADLSGPRKQLDSVKQELLPQNGVAAVQIDLDASLEPGKNHILPTATLLSKNPLFVQNGITVLSCIPQKITVWVDRMDEKTVKVGIPASATNLASPAVFEPYEVKLRGPQTVLQEAQRDGKLAAYIDTSALVGFKPGAYEEDLPVITSLKDRHVTVIPNMVHAKVTVKEADEAWTIPSMPIWILIPPDLSRQYKVEYVGGGPFLNNVTVSGPPQAIEMLKQQQVKYKAFVEVSNDDLPVNHVVTRKVRYDLPPGIKASETDAKRTVDFKLMDQSAAE